MRYLITGAAGFIGMHTIKKLLEDGNNEIVGIDNLNFYYDINLKLDRLKELGITEILDSKEMSSKKYSNFKFIKLDIESKEKLVELFEENKFEIVINLAAQAGVRYSIDNPDSYMSRNIVGFYNIIEVCRKFKPKHLLYASSSSIYGNNAEVPFKEDQNVDKVISLYAATKKSNELVAHVYSNLYNIPTTGLRFFTVYGPWGRPDMAPMIFTKSILSGEEIQVFNKGELYRDFTYVDDIVEGIIGLVDHIPNGETPYEIFNIGKGSPVKLLDFIDIVEAELGVDAKRKYVDMQPGDVFQTYADTTKIEKAIGYKPKTSLKEGIKEFVKWYRNYYK